MTIVATAVAGLLFLSPAQAQDDRGRAAGFSVDFRWDRAVLDPAYKNTGERLRALADSIASIGIGSIDSLSVLSFSSPEGNYTYNLRLAERRAAAVGGYLRSNWPDLDGRLRVSGGGESWQLLRERVLSSTSLSETQKRNLLSIIDSPVSAEQKKALIHTYDPALWNRLVRHWFPDMRRTFIRLNWTEPRPEFPSVPVLSARQPDVTLTSQGSGLIPSSRESYGYRTILALKTNLLYDLVTALNFELEVPLGDRFSLAVEDVFPWWNWGPNGRKYCFQMWEIGVEPRWWFAKNPERDRLSGHFLGLYAMSAKYDFQWDTKLCWQGEYWSTGLTYGYSMPLGEVCNLELSASLGFLRSDWRHYQPDESYEHLYRDPFRTGVFSWFGPTKLKVSLVVPIQVKYRRNAR